MAPCCVARAAVPPGCGQGHIVHCALWGRPELVQSILFQGMRILPLRVTKGSARGVEAPRLLAGIHLEEGEDV